jgi:peptidoglycan/xylan/chitin deacetylase (PgdA/CDA1 family)
MRALPLAAAGAVGWTLPALMPHVPPLCHALGVPRRLEPPRGAVAVTFDDGPHPEGTPAVLEILDRAGARATFFMVGEQAERYPALAAEVAAAGHGIALHGYRHRNALRLTPSAFADDLDRGAEAVSGATGRPLDLYRPPYGIFSAAALALVRRRSLAPLLWSRWGRDWARRVTPQSIAAKATQDLGPGDVVLLHDADFYSAQGSWRRTAAALPAVLDAIVARGLRPDAV